MEQEITDQEQSGNYTNIFQGRSQNSDWWNRYIFFNIVPTFVDNKTKEQREYIEKLKSSAEDVEFEEI